MAENLNELYNYAYMHDNPTRHGDSQSYQPPSQTEGNYSEIEDTSKKCKKWHICCVIIVLLVGLLFSAMAAYLGFRFLHISTTPKSSISSPPNITNCPDDISRSAAPDGPTSVTVWWMEPSAINPSGGKLFLERTHQPGQSFGIGETTVTYNFTGDGGAQSSCEFKIIVILIDESPPTITNCPQNKIYRTPSDSNSITVWFKEPTATGASRRTVTIIKSSPEYTPGSRFDIGATTINYIFVDTLGLHNTCSFRITVIDLIPPAVYNCPKDIEFYLDSELISKPISWNEPLAKDNSGNVTLINASHTPGSRFHIGSTEVRYVFADTTGNIALCTFTVTGESKSPSSGIEKKNTQASSSFILIISLIVIWFYY